MFEVRRHKAVSTIISDFTSSWACHIILADVHICSDKVLSNRLRKGDEHRDTSQDNDAAVIARRDITDVLYLDARNNVMAVSAIVSLWLMPAWIRNERARASLVSTSKPPHVTQRRISARSRMIGAGFDKEMIYGYKYKKSNVEARERRKTKRDRYLFLARRRRAIIEYNNMCVTEIYK